MEEELGNGKDGRRRTEEKKKVLIGRAPNNLTICCHVHLTPCEKGRSSLE